MDKVRYFICLNDFCIAPGKHLFRVINNEIKSTSPFQNGNWIDACCTLDSLIYTSTRKPITEQQAKQLIPEAF